MSASPTAGDGHPTAEQIASALLEVRARQRSEHRWFWGTMVCRLVMALGALTIAAAPFIVVFAIVEEKRVAWSIVQATMQAAIGFAIILAAWWGHRFAWSNAFPRDSTARTSPDGAARIPTVGPIA